MKNLLSLFLFIIPLQVIHAQQDIKDLYRQLELSLAQRNIASQRKEARIDSIQNLITPDMSAQKLFEHYYTLYQEYLTYRSDSAFFILTRRKKLLHEPIFSSRNIFVISAGRPYWPQPDIFSGFISVTTY